MLVSNKGSGRGSEFSRQRAPIGITTRKCSECTTSGTLSELRPPVEIAAAAALCPFKLEYIWYAFEPRIYRGFKRPSAEGVQVGQRAALYPLPGAQETSRDNCGERPRWVESSQLPRQAAG